MSGILILKVFSLSGWISSRSLLEGDLCQLYSDSQLSPDPVPEPGAQGWTTRRRCQEVWSAQAARYRELLVYIVKKVFYVQFLFLGEFLLRLRHLEQSLLQALNEVKGRILDDDRWVFCMHFFTEVFAYVYYCWKVQFYCSIVSLLAVALEAFPAADSNTSIYMPSGISDSSSIYQYMRWYQYFTGPLDMHKYVLHYRLLAKVDIEKVNTLTSKEKENLCLIAKVYSRLIDR